jgi:hypothetical protein
MRSIELSVKGALRPSRELKAESSKLKVES